MRHLVQAQHSASRGGLGAQGPRYLLAVCCRELHLSNNLYNGFRAAGPEQLFITPKSLEMLGGNGAIYLRVFLKV